MQFGIGIVSLLIGALAVFLYHRKVLLQQLGFIADRDASIKVFEAEVSQLKQDKAGLEVTAAMVGRLELKQADLEGVIRERDDRISELREQLARAEQEQESTLKTLEDAEKRFEATFNDLANKAMTQSAEQFLTLASEKLKGLNEESSHDLQKRQVAIQELVKPLEEKLNKLDESTRLIEEKRGEAYGGLTEQVRQMMEAQAKTDQSTRNLIRALRNPGERGRWGEVQLRRVVEFSGMVEHCDFETQVTVTGDSGRLRPDMIVHLPGQRKIVVDAKVPFDAYSKAIEAETEEERKEMLTLHSQQVKKHIDQLSKKSYQQQFDGALDFVVLFMPADPMLTHAMEADPSLWETAAESNVILCTPSTLIVVLKSASTAWRQEQIQQNAIEISVLGRDLYKRLGTLADHFGKVGKNLNQAVNSYNSAVGTLELRVLPSARKFKEMDAALQEEIGELETVDNRSRVMQSSELKSLGAPTPPAVGSLFELS